jgi:hypothetical protein
MPPKLLPPNDSPPPSALPPENPPRVPEGALKDLEVVLPSNDLPPGIAEFPMVPDCMPLLSTRGDALTLLTRVLRLSTAVALLWVEPDHLEILPAEIPPSALCAGSILAKVPLAESRKWLLK